MVACSVVRRVPVIVPLRGAWVPMALARGLLAGQGRTDEARPYLESVIATPERSEQARAAKKALR